MRTGRTGAAAKAGHDLLIHVTAWEATLEVGDDPAETSIELDADATSLRVREGTGGMQALGDDDKASIEQTIDDEVLEAAGHRVPLDRGATAPTAAGSACEGDLTLVGDDPADRVRPRRRRRRRAQRPSPSSSRRDWGIKPYSALFGALKVADEVEVAIERPTLRAWPQSR